MKEGFVRQEMYLDRSSTDVGTMQSGAPVLGRDWSPDKLTEDYLTERDIDVGFEVQAPIPHMQRAKHTARKFRNSYWCNARWWKSLVYRTLPIIETIRTYKKQYLAHDVAAGLATGASAIPIGMSYALLARLPPQYGLYNQLFYCIIYMCLGTSQHTCLGASAIESMLCAQGVAGIVGWDAPQDVWLNCCVGLSLFVGVNLIGLRFCSLGFITNFLPDPIVSSFSTGAAVTIAISQLQHLFGVPTPNGANNLAILGHLLSHIGETKWSCIFIGCIGILMFVCLHKLNQRWLTSFPLPNSLIVIALFIFVGWLFSLDKAPFNLPIVGAVPSGFPAPQSFNFSRHLVTPLYKASLLYTFVYLFMHASVTRSVSQKWGYRVELCFEY